MNEEILKKDLWKTEMEILDVIHQICKKNNLKYSLAYGTLIGAIRHQGFIPWDDDIDIFMPRDDYNQLLKIWKDEAPESYILQNSYTDSDYVNNFTKIRKNHTTFLQYEWEKEKKYHKGIFVDIFPMDRVAEGKFSNKMQYLQCLINLLYSRGYTSGSKGIVGLAERMFLSIPKNKYIVQQKKSENKIAKWNTNSHASWMCACTLPDCKRYYDSHLFDEIAEGKFEDRCYCITKKYDSCLRECYGDYMKLPPKEEQKWTHHPIAISFDKNYEELTESEILS